MSNLHTKEIKVIICDKSIHDQKQSIPAKKKAERCMLPQESTIAI